MSKKTLVLGASVNPIRYSNIAIKRLIANNHKVRAIGISEGIIDGVKIHKTKKKFKKIDTITLYLNKTNQQEYYTYLISLKPNRVIFNPGTENLEFENILVQHNIFFDRACTLVLLGIGEY